MTIERDGMRVWPADISGWPCLEVDLQEDLDRANQTSVEPAGAEGCAWS